MEQQLEVIEDYQILGVVGQGACGVVYKVRNMEDGQIVALKLLKPLAEGTSVDQLRFEREFRLTSACEHPFLVKTLTYSHSEERPFYTMELIEGSNFTERFKDLPKGRDIEVFTKVVEGLLDALDHIHQRGIIHRDLKPENVLVDAADNPRLLDFGLAKPQYSDEDGPQLTNPGTVLGTVHYLSPEQLSSRPLDPRSDLFSLGSMLYEVLAGRLPFDAEHPMAVFGQILANEPPALSLPDSFPSGLVELIRKLMSKDPADRQQTARELLADWRRVMLGVEESVLARPIEMPEQLYQSRFLGQEQAFAAFEQMRSCRTTPRVLLVAGNTGAGKSRFLEECSAQVKMRGSGTQSWGRASEVESLSYQIWLNPLRNAFKRPSPALLPLRAVLSPLLPELGFFKETATTKSQLFEAMSRVLRTAHQGGLIWLEDLHLGDSASLEFLHYLARSLTPVDNLTIVASYDDSQAEQFLKTTRNSLLATEFAREVTLEPLDQTAISVMVASMLGGGEFEEDSASLLYSEAGGNPLFISEVVKAALADQRLELIGNKWQLKDSGESSSIPRTIRDQLSRQLKCIEEKDFEVLKYAAAIGPNFDFDLLSRTSSVPKVELLDRLLRLSAKGFLLETEGGHFRFRSRALIQVLLESIPAQSRPPLHRSIALVMETLQPRQRWVVELARQYQAAGEPQKAVTHLLAAGAEAMRNFAHGAAVDIYTRALQVPADKRVGTGDDLLLENIADARQGLGQYQEAASEYERLLSEAKATVSQVRLRRKVAECQQMLGKFRTAHEHLSQGLRLLGAAPGGQGASTTTPMNWVKKNFQKISTKFHSDEVMSRQIHRILDRQLSTLFFLRPPSWRESVHELASLQENVAKKLGNPEAAAQAQIFLGFVDLHRGRRESALENWATGIAITNELRDSPYKALLLRNMGLMHLLAGEATKAMGLCRGTQAICQRLGDRPGLTQNHMVCCAIELHWAHFDKALEHAKAMLETADDVGLPVYRALAWSYLARATAHNDHLDEAQQHLAEGLAMAKDLELPYVDMMMAIARAWVLCDLGKYEASMRAVREGLDFCAEIGALPFYQLTLRCAGLFAATEWKENGTPPEEVMAKLPVRLREFHEEAVSRGITQFMGISTELGERLSGQCAT